MRLRMTAATAALALMATASGAWASGPTYYMRQRFAGMTPKAAAAAPTYTGTWGAATWTTTTACSGGSKTQTSSSACSTGSDSDCDPATKPASATRTQSCTLVCATMTPNTRGVASGNATARSLGYVAGYSSASGPETIRQSCQGYNAGTGYEVVGCEWDSGGTQFVWYRPVGSTSTPTTTSATRMYGACTQQ